MAGDWSLPDEERSEAVNRLASNIASLAFSAGVTITDGEATKLAEKAEQKAYIVAGVESRTSTGLRPHDETFRAYTRSRPLRSSAGSIAPGVVGFWDQECAEVKATALNDE